MYHLKSIGSGKRAAKTIATPKNRASVLVLVGSEILSDVLGLPGSHTTALAMALQAACPRLRISGLPGVGTVVIDAPEGTRIRTAEAEAILATLSQDHTPVEAVETPAPGTPELVLTWAPEGRVRVVSINVPTEAEALALRDGIRYVTDHERFQADYSVRVLRTGDGRHALRVFSGRYGQEMSQEEAGRITEALGWGTLAEARHDARETGPAPVLPEAPAETPTPSGRSGTVEDIADDRGVWSVRLWTRTDEEALDVVSDLIPLLPTGVHTAPCRHEDGTPGAMMFPAQGGHPLTEDQLRAAYEALTEVLRAIRDARRAIGETPEEGSQEGQEEGGTPDPTDTPAEALTTPGTASQGHGKGASQGGTSPSVSQGVLSSSPAPRSPAPENPETPPLGGAPGALGEDTPEACSSCGIEGASTDDLTWTEGRLIHLDGCPSPDPRPVTLDVTLDEDGQPIMVSAPVPLARVLRFSGRAVEAEQILAEGLPDTMLGSLDNDGEGYVARIWPRQSYRHRPRPMTVREVELARGRIEEVLGRPVRTPACLRGPQLPPHDRTPLPEPVTRENSAVMACVQALAEALQEDTPTPAPEAHPVRTEAPDVQERTGPPTPYRGAMILDAETGVEMAGPESLDRMRYTTPEGVREYARCASRFFQVPTLVVWVRPLSEPLPDPERYDNSAEPWTLGDVETLKGHPQPSGVRVVAPMRPSVLVLVLLVLLALPTLARASGPGWSTPHPMVTEAIQEEEDARTRTEVLTSIRRALTALEDAERAVLRGMVGDPVLRALHRSDAATSTAFEALAQLAPEGVHDH